MKKYLRRFKYRRLSKAQILKTLNDQGFLVANASTRYTPKMRLNVMIITYASNTMYSDFVVKTFENSDDREKSLFAHLEEATVHDIDIKNIGQIKQVAALLGIPVVWRKLL